MIWIIINLVTCFHQAVEFQMTMLITNWKKLFFFLEYSVAGCWYFISIKWSVVWRLVNRLYFLRLFFSIEISSSCIFIFYAVYSGSENSTTSIRQRACWTIVYGQYVLMFIRGTFHSFEFAFRMCSTDSCKCQFNDALVLCE